MQASKKVKVGGIILLNANKSLVKLLKFHDIEKLMFENVQKKKSIMNNFYRYSIHDWKEI